jgi:SAM-dependent methyltransferase
VIHRENFATRTRERWQPPAFRAPRTPWIRLLAAARRLVDLQAASVWRDLQVLLADARGVVLDVGAGAQPYRPLLPRHVRYRAIDVAAARPTFGYDVPDTEYFDGDRWPVEDAEVDLVLATETLEHVPEPERFLRQARRVLRPGGRFVATVPFSARWHYVPYDYWRFTPSSLRRLLEGSGFCEIAVYPRGNEVTVAAGKVMALILMWLFPTGGGIGPRRVTAALLMPVVAALTLVARLSLRAEGGEDCLGWTVTAVAAWEVSDGSTAPCPADPSGRA